MTKDRVDRAQVERAARLYHSTADAAQALGLSKTGFARICRRLGVQTPYERSRKR